MEEDDGEIRLQRTVFVSLIQEVYMNQRYSDSIEPNQWSLKMKVISIKSYRANRNNRRSDFDRNVELAATSQGLDSIMQNAPDAEKGLAAVLGAVTWLRVVMEEAARRRVA